ncbi:MULTISPECIES: hypothetical protein [unclassified Streptomyces]|uniref:hypothetical protein n=1 Tax=unclassified Streptomyces TaxID=2593676 RepID=UPI0019083C03|nr:MULTISPECIES: hypothetical protein [unclassified Streptomyces]MCU4746338.1 hypothetical protein [Streptomyces sp. G-5]QQN76627.1 hypothetical protein IPZ77_03605 [Streptomyces sp. XC 2026]
MNISPLWNDGGFGVEGGAQDFNLWFPRYEVKQDSVLCAVDVVPADVYLIDRGEGRLMQHFAECLGLPGPIESWSLVPFFTPFYAHNLASEDWRDVLTPAWHLSLRSAHSGTVPSSPASPVPAWGHDPTWWEHRSPWSWEMCRATVISFNGPDPDSSFLDDLGLPLDVSGHIYSEPHAEVSQLRITLPPLSIPNDLDTVFRVVEACYRQAYVVHSSAVDHLFLP